MDCGTLLYVRLQRFQICYICCIIFQLSIPQNWFALPLSHRARQANMSTCNCTDHCTLAYDIPWAHHHQPATKAQSRQSETRDESISKPKPKPTHKLLPEGGTRGSAHSSAVWGTLFPPHESHWARTRLPPATQQSSVAHAITRIDPATCLEGEAGGVL